MLAQLYESFSKCDFDSDEVSLLRQSYQAFCAAEEYVYEQERTARAVNGANRILQEFPDVGETIEKFVEEHQLGADAWRRTGVLTLMEIQR